MGNSIGALHGTRLGRKRLSEGIAINATMAYARRLGNPYQKPQDWRIGCPHLVS